jgi:chlorite dismutase
MNPIHAHEGWFVSHLFYRINRTVWEALDSSQQTQQREKFQRVVKDFQKAENCQICCYSVWGLKADLGILLISPELQSLNNVELDLSTALSPGVLEPVDSFVSLSETSEYMSQTQDYDRTLKEKEGLTPDSPEYREKMEAFQARMQVYINERLYPKIPEHQVVCFYPMNKQRGDKENWYLLDFEKRKQYMAGHAITGRKFQPHVRQLVTGSIALDNWEWGVTLFADDPFYFKKLLYEMRYDEASARFAEFGDFYIGIHLEPGELLTRLRL